MIGFEIKTVEMGWPIGMPLVRKMNDNLWKARVGLPDGRTARILFTVSRSRLVLLHGFIKKAQKTPTKELDIAKKRLKEVKRGETYEK